MTFKYFDKPELYVEVNKAKTRCDICDKEDFCFDASLFYGKDELTSICPVCLGNGSLAQKDTFTCDGDVVNLTLQLKALYPLLPDSEIQIMAEKKTIELETTTPHLITWQDWSWPCSDGDYCRFIGYGSKPLYTQLAKQTSVEIFFEESFYEPESYLDYLWEEVVPDKEIKDYADSNTYNALFYVFKSLNSDKIITIWDCN